MARRDRGHLSEMGEGGHRAPEAASARGRVPLVPGRLDRAAPARGCDRGRHAEPPQCDHGDRHVRAGRADRAPPRRQAPWTFIAGEQEPGETFADTIIREVKEETGLEITAGEILGERVHPKTDRHMVYVAARPAGKLDAVVGDPDELSEVKWASLPEADELLPGMFEPVRAHLGRALTLDGDDAD